MVITTVGIVAKRKADLDNLWAGKIRKSINALSTFGYWLFLFQSQVTEVYSEPSQISRIERFAEMVDG